MQFRLFDNKCGKGNIIDLPKYKKKVSFTFFVDKNPEVPKMVTPAELERMGASEAVVAKLSETPRTTPRLKRISPGYFTNMFSKKG